MVRLAWLVRSGPGPGAYFACGWLVMKRAVEKKDQCHGTLLQKTKKPQDHNSKVLSSQSECIYVPKSSK